MIKKINTYPKDIKILKMKADKVELTLNSPMSPNEFWGVNTVKIIEQLKATAEKYKNSCVGLAANQIWENEVINPPAIFVVLWPSTTLSSDDKFEWKEFINPEIKVNGPTKKEAEGCMSIPGKVTFKKRKSNVTISYQDLLSMDIKTEKIYGKAGLWSRIIQHEYDHLQGKII
jgi:peptide deformylase